MRNNRRRVISIAALLLLSCSVFLPAVEDPRETYVVAVTGFTALGLPREHQYVAEALPRLMLHALSGLDTHYFSAREKRAYFQRLEAEALRTAELNLAEERKTNSLTAIKAGTETEEPEDPDRDSRQAPESVKGDAGGGTVPAGWSGYKKLEILNESGKIPDLPPDAARFCRRRQADMLISGRIEAIGDLVYFSLSAYSFAFGTWNEFFVSAGGFTSLEEALDQAKGALRKEVLGRPWSSLSLTTGRPDAMIFLDGELEGIGSLNDLVVEPGDHQLKITAEAAQDFETRISLGEGEEVKKSFELAPAAVPAVGVSTLPEGAEVYLSSRWVGTTPLFLPDSGRDGTLRIVLEGYSDLLVPARQLEPGKNSFTLEESFYDPAARLKKKRDNLYTAVGLFTLSLPVTMFSYSLYRDYWNQSSMYGDQGLADTAFLYNGLFYGSLYGSSVLFVHMIRSLVEYRTAGNETF